MKTKNLVLLLLLFVVTTTASFAADSLFAQKSFYSQEPELTLIESLIDGESYSIEILSIGCFNGAKQMVVVSKEAGVLKASFQDTVKTLTPSDILAFKNFEIQLKSLEIGGCTTVDTYTLRFGSQIYTTSDGTCSWNGGKKLLKAIS